MGLFGSGKARGVRPLDRAATSRQPMRDRLHLYNFWLMAVERSGLIFRIRQQQAADSLSLPPR
jgi:hypothetical protein